jgi:hypothetical protein
MEIWRGVMMSRTAQFELLSSESERAGVSARKRVNRESEQAER